MINELQNKIKVLEDKKVELEERLHIQKDIVEYKINAILKTVIAGEVNKPYIQFYTRDNGLEFRATVGYKKNPDEERLEFGSTWDIHYEEGKLEVNQGCIGSYSMHDNYGPFQLLRAKDIVNVLENALSLEKQFSEISLARFFELRDEAKELEHEINSIKADIDKIKFNQTLESVAAGQDYFYGKDVTYYSLIGRLAKNYCDWSKVHYRIDKITNKCVKVAVYNKDDIYVGNERFDKDMFIHCIRNGKLVCGVN